MLTKFYRNQSGNSAIIFALALVPLLAATGAGLDMTRAMFAKSELQGALDAAALAAATAANATSNSARVTAGRNIFQANFTLSAPPAPLISINNGTVTAEASYAVQTSLLAAVHIDTVLVTGRSVAAVQVNPDPCVLLLDEGGNSLNLNSGSHLNAGCGVYVNSSASNAIYINSQSGLVATDVCVTGKYQIDSSSTSMPTPATNCPVRLDPLASLPEPSHGGCNHTDLVIQNGSTRTLNPGVYCKKLEIQNNATVTLNPGIYYFPDTELIVNSYGRLRGQNVMLYFSGSHGRINANSDSEVQLTAPVTGTYKGIVLFQSRSGISAEAEQIVNSNSTSYFEGMIYAPKGKIMLNSDSTLNANAEYTFVIAGRMEVNSNGRFSVNNKSGTRTPLPDRISASTKYARLTQ